ncbi:hypothetical protein BOX15_Mlig006190g3 [Macrostomum lignano]|uniref:Uncharacterized protein n=1 Tax=Macrostomum lignano TaxID=282301 RepID=A0A267GFQ1_9PLAT|nr:hypothetical protein BOX15_Mlig006190g3 [Macrostomum lignano]
MHTQLRTALLAILVAGIGPIVFVGGFHVGLVDEDPNPALEWLSIDPRARNLQQSENQPQQQGPAISKRFLFHSNGDCFVLRVQCFTNRDCARRHNSLSYRCVMRRCAVICHHVNNGL